MIKMNIMDIPSSNNKYQGQGSKSKAIRDYPIEKKLWVQLIWIQKSMMKASGELTKEQLQQLPLQQATIILHYHFRTHIRRDPDNYSGKVILDALKDQGFITDDSFKEIDIFPMADFGIHKKDNIDIYIIPEKRLEGIVRKWIEGETIS